MENDDASLTAQNLTTFNLKMLAYSDHRLIPHLLHSMPRLQRFYFYLNRKIITDSYSPELLEGHFWKRMLDAHAANLSQFEFYLIIRKAFPLLNLHDIVASFIPISRRYPHWHMMVEQWTMYQQTDSE